MNNDGYRLAFPLLATLHGRKTLRIATAIGIARILSFSNDFQPPVWTDEPEAIVIENAAAAKAYKSYFDFMWKHAKKFK